MHLYLYNPEKIEKETIKSYKSFDESYTLQLLIEEDIQTHMYYDNMIIIENITGKNTSLRKLINSLPVSEIEHPPGFRYTVYRGNKRRKRRKFFRDAPFMQSRVFYKQGGCF